MKHMESEVRVIWLQIQVPYHIICLISVNILNVFDYFPLLQNGDNMVEFNADLLDKIYTKIYMVSCT